jgi:predicted PurR-regulated permease PerM
VVDQVAADEQSSEAVDRWPNRRIIFLAVVLGLILYAIFKLPPTITYVLLRVRDILTMLVLSVALAYFLLPTVKLLERIKVPLARRAKRDTATILAMLLVGALFVVLVMLTSQPVGEELSRLAKITTEWAKELPQAATEWVKRNSNRIPVEWQTWLENEFSAEQALVTPAEGQTGLAGKLLANVSDWVGAVVGWHANLLKNVALRGSYLIALLVIPVFTFYFITDASRMRNGLRSLLPRDASDACDGMMIDVHRVLQGYVGTLIVISIGTGVATAITLYLAGVPVYLTFGIMAGVANLIPVVGPIIAGVLMCAITLLQVGWRAMLVVLAVYLLIQLVSDRLVAPKLMSDSARLHPLVVILSLLAGAEFFGAIGLFVAVPSVAAGRVAWLHYRLWAASDDEVVVLQDMLGMRSKTDEETDEPAAPDQEKDAADGNC